MLNRLLSACASRIKGDEYRLDTRIPDGYLLGVAVARITMRLRGFMRFPIRTTHPFIGKRVTLRAKSGMSFGAGVTLADGSLVDALSIRGVRFGDNVSIGRNTRIECTGNLRTLGAGIDVGDNTGLGSDCYYGCAGGIAIGANTIVGNNVSFHSENHVIDHSDRPIRLQGVTHIGITVGENCWLGARCTVLDGAVIEDGCVFAAGAVITAGRYERDGIYAGVPARRIRSRLTTTASKAS